MIKSKIFYDPREEEIDTFLKETPGTIVSVTQSQAVTGSIETSFYSHLCITILYEVGTSNDRFAMKSVYSNSK